MDKVELRFGTERRWVVGSEFGLMLEAVKRIPGRQWDAAAKAWRFPAEDLERVEKAISKAVAYGATSYDHAMKVKLNLSLVNSPTGTNIERKAFSDLYPNAIRPSDLKK